MKVSRREFIRGGLLGLAGGVVLYGSSRFLTTAIQIATAASGTDYRHDLHDWENYYYGFGVNTYKCIGCGRCVQACKTENHVPDGEAHNRTWVERYTVTTDGKIFIDSPESGIHGFPRVAEEVEQNNSEVRKSFFVPKLCNQCDKPPCVQVCPVAATYQTRDGVILIDQQRCIGCRYCIQACPYGARYLLPLEGVSPTGQVGVADKCTWCYHRITKGLLPACVEACPVGARVFGDLRDADSPINRLLSSERIGVLKPDLGTKPKVYYVGLGMEVR